MTKSNTTEADFIAAAFLGVDPAWRPVAGQASLYLALHTADPGEGGNQATSEVAYTGYARLAVVRSAVGWTVAGGQVANAAQLQFPVCTGVLDDVTATHVSVGLLAATGGQILYSGALLTPCHIVNQAQPQLPAGSLVAAED